MTRQRLNLRTPALGYLVAALTLVLALALVWYGLMVGAAGRQGLAAHRELAQRLPDAV